MRFVINTQDEPRVAFDYRKPDAFDRVFNQVRPRPRVFMSFSDINVQSLTDRTPFEHTPRPTADFFMEAQRCLLPRSPKGFGTIVNEDNACERIGLKN